MSRYIDADELKAKKRFYTNEQRYVVRMTDIYKAPSIDIVRCKDCQRYEEDSIGWYCDRYKCDMFAYDFCSRGERRNP